MNLFEIRPRRHHLGYSLVAISGGIGLYPKSDLRNFGKLHIKKIIKYTSLAFLWDQKAILYPVSTVLCLYYKCP